MWLGLILLILGVFITVFIIVNSLSVENKDEIDVSGTFYFIIASMIVLVVIVQIFDSDILRLTAYVIDNEVK